jgi:hypothetical protein
MRATANAAEIFAASQMHLNILEEFIGTVEVRLTAPLPAFTRESLTELLASLRERRASYRFLVQADALVA